MTERNHTIDTVKGLCIIMVIITHFNWSDSSRLKYLFPFWIDMAVPVFMVITGFVVSKSFERKNIKILDDCFQKNILMGKAIRFSFPFLIVFIAEIPLAYHSKMANTLLSFSKAFIYGGFGPGSYYYPEVLYIK